MTDLTYKNLKADLQITQNKALDKVFRKIKRNRTQRKIAGWLGVGSLLYGADQLDKKGKVTPATLLPALFFGYVTFAIYNEKNLLEKAIKVY